MPRSILTGRLDAYTAAQTRTPQSAPPKKTSIHTDIANTLAAVDVRRRTTSNQNMPTQRKMLQKLLPSEVGIKRGDVNAEEAVVEFLCSFEDFAEHKGATETLDDVLDSGLLRTINHSKVVTLVKPETFDFLKARFTGENKDISLIKFDDDRCYVVKNPALKESLRAQKSFFELPSDAHADHVYGQTVAGKYDPFENGKNFGCFLYGPQNAEKFEYYQNATTGRELSDEEHARLNAYLGGVAQEVAAKKMDSQWDITTPDPSLGHLWDSAETRELLDRGHKEVKTDDNACRQLHRDIQKRHPDAEYADTMLHFLVQSLNRPSA